LNASVSANGYFLIKYGRKTLAFVEMGMLERNIHFVWNLTIALCQSRTFRDSTPRS
jgi:hypothetical protein